MRALTTTGPERLDRPVGTTNERRSATLLRSPRSGRPHEGVSFAEFSDLVSNLSRWARCRQLRMPGVQSPPRAVGVERVVRRLGGEVRTIAVTVRGRRRHDVLVDVVSGILLANGVARHEWATLIADAAASVEIGPSGPRWADAA